MKKLLLSVAVILVTAFYVNAQSYTLEKDGEVLGDTVSVYPSESSVTNLSFEVVHKVIL